MSYYYYYRPSGSKPEEAGLGWSRLSWPVVATILGSAFIYAGTVTTDLINQGMADRKMLEERAATERARESELIRALTTQVSSMTTLPETPKILALSTYREHAIPVLVALLAMLAPEVDKTVGNAQIVQAIELSLQTIARDPQAKEPVAKALAGLLAIPNGKSSWAHVEASAIKVLRILGPEHPNLVNWEKYGIVARDRYSKHSEYSKITEALNINSNKAGQ